MQHHNINTIQIMSVI